MFASLAYSRTEPTLTKPHQFRRFVSTSCACFACRCCTGFLRLYWADTEAERPLDSVKEARKFVGIFLVLRCEPLCLLATEKQERGKEQCACLNSGWVSKNIVIRKGIVHGKGEIGDGTGS